MKSDKSTSSTSVIAKQQKQTNSAVGKSKLTQTNSAKKHQPQAKKKTLTSKLVNGVSEPCKLAGSLTNGNLSDSNANHLTKDDEESDSDDPFVNAMNSLNRTLKAIQDEVTSPKKKEHTSTLSAERKVQIAKRFEGLDSRFVDQILKNWIVTHN